MPHSETALGSIIRTIILCCCQTHLHQAMKVQVKVQLAEKSSPLSSFSSIQINLI